jgi:hypothetical protein
MVKNAIDCNLADCGKDTKSELPCCDNANLSLPVSGMRSRRIARKMIPFSEKSTRICDITEWTAPNIDRAKGGIHRIIFGMTSETANF